jgi:molybdenum storage protein
MRVYVCFDDTDTIDADRSTGKLARWFEKSLPEGCGLWGVVRQQGGIKIGHDEIVKLTSYFLRGCIPVMHGMPPYDYFAIPPAKGRIPLHRTDVGTIILADLIGARMCIFVKDGKGLYTGDPEKNPNEEFIPEIGARTLMEKDQDDLIIERPCLEILQNSEVLERITIINGLEEGNITRALNGENAGTIIYKE